MSMLNRFRKPGGFQQLLALIESCEPARQKTLLNLIGSEDPGWAQLVKLKMLTFERVLSWPVEILMEVTASLPDLVLATAFQMAGHLNSRNGSDLQEKWLKSLPMMKAREIQELSSFHAFSASEQSTSVVKILQTVREIEAQGRIRFSSFDPLLEIDKRIAA